MKRFLALFLVLALGFTFCSSAFGESSDVEAQRQRAFAPFDHTVTVKAVKGYSESAKPGVKPSTCYWNEVLKEYLNIEVDWLWEVPDDQYNTKLSVTLASGNVPDVLQCDFQTFNYLKEAGALVDLSAVWEEYASPALKESMAALDNEPLKKCTYDGKLLAIPYATDAAERIQVLYYRTDWLKNVGLELPKTLDDFTNVIKAFRDNDPDGDGEKNTYGLAMYSNPLAGSISYMPIFNAFGSYPSAWILKEDKLVNGLLQDETKEALDYLRGLYAEGYIDPEFATLSFEQAKARLANSQSGILAGYWYEPDTGLTTETLQNCETAEWQAQAMVGQTADAPAKVLQAENTISLYNVVLSTASEDAAIAMIKMLNMFYDYNFFSEEQSDWPWYNRIYAGDSDEYKAIDDRHYSWWLPVNIWDAAACHNQSVAMTKLYNTGVFDLYISKGNEEANIRFKNWAEYAKYDRADMKTEDDLSMWITAYRMCLSRMDTARGECSFTIATKLKNDGNTVLNRFYGAETETGNAVASTLNDYATEFVNKYIMGTNTETWENFVSNYNAMGGEQWAVEVNESYAALQ